MFFFDYIFLLFAAALIRLQTKIALLFVMEAAFYPRCHSSGSDLDIASKRNSQRAGHACSCSLRSPPSISNRRLSNILFVFYSLPFFCCIFWREPTSGVDSGRKFSRWSSGFYLHYSRGLLYS